MEAPPPPGAGDAEWLAFVTRRGATPGARRMGKNLARLLAEQKANGMT